MKALWLTDIHLEFLNDSSFTGFMAELRKENADAILISGDIAQAPTVEEFLLQMEQELQVPIYFVLGNHDFYNGSISGVRTAITGMVKKSHHLNWLNISGVVNFSQGTSLIGHDGWGDAGYGDYHNSPVRLNDFLLISELSGLSSNELFNKLQQLGEEAAEHFRKVLPGALRSADHVVVLTHVPPFTEAAWHEGDYCDAHWLPFFACKAVGDVLIEEMKNHPGKHMTVLCGHTHSRGTSAILPNLIVCTGEADYGYPVIQKVFHW